MRSCAFCKQSVPDEQTMHTVQVCSGDTKGRAALAELGCASDEPTVTACACAQCTKKIRKAQAS